MEKIYTSNLSKRIRGAINPSLKDVFMFDTNILRRLLALDDNFKSDIMFHSLVSNFSPETTKVFFAFALVEYSTDSYSNSLNYQRILDAEVIVQKRLHCDVSFEDYNGVLESEYRLSVYARFLKVSEIVLKNGASLRKLESNFSEFISWLISNNLRIYSHLYTPIIEILSNTGKYNSLIKARKKDYLNSCRSTAHDYNMLRSSYKILQDRGIVDGFIPNLYIATEDEALNLLCDSYYSPVSIFDPEGQAIYLSITQVDFPEKTQIELVEKLNHIIDRANNLESMINRVGGRENRLQDIIKELEKSVMSLDIHR